jgi:hypothetical protein
MQKDDDEDDDPPMPGADAYWAGMPQPGTEDYYLLPFAGLHHYSLSDAAHLAARVVWGSDGIPDFPRADYPDGLSSPQAQVGFEQFERRLLDALVRSVNAGQFDAEVLGRNLKDSALIPDRTYIRLDTLEPWLTIHELKCGGTISDMVETSSGDVWEIAARVAEDRALRRRPLRAESSEPDLDPADKISALQQQVRALRLHVQRLQHEQEEIRDGDERLSGPAVRQHRTALAVIAALCKSAGININARGAAADIVSATHEIQSPVSHQTIRDMVLEIPDALEARSKEAISKRRP